MTDKLTDKEFKEIADSVPTPKNMTDWEKEIIDYILHNYRTTEKSRQELLDKIKSEIKKAVEEVSEVGITRYLDPILNEYDYEFDLEDILKSRGIE